MGGRNNANVLRDLFQTAAMLPWWAGLVLATAAYGVRKRAATLAKKGKPWSVPDCSGWA